MAWLLMSRCSRPLFKKPGRDRYRLTWAFDVGGSPRGGSAGRGALRSEGACGAVVLGASGGRVLVVLFGEGLVWGCVYLVKCVQGVGAYVQRARWEGRVGVERLLGTGAVAC